MSKALQIIGGIWAGLGVLNIIGMFMKTDSSQQGLQLFGLLLNMLLFLFPGLVLVGIGALLQRRKADALAETARLERSIEAKIRREVEAERSLRAHPAGDSER